MAISEKGSGLPYISESPPNSCAKLPDNFPSVKPSNPTTRFAHFGLRIWLIREFRLPFIGHSLILSEIADEERKEFSKQPMRKVAAVWGAVKRSFLRGGTFPRAQTVLCPPSSQLGCRSPSNIPFPIRSAVDRFRCAQRNRPRMRSSGALF